MSLGYWNGLGFGPLAPAGGGMLTTGKQPSGFQPVTEVSPVIGTTTGPLVTGTPAGNGNLVGDVDLSVHHPNIDTGHINTGDLGLPGLDTHPDATAELERCKQQIAETGGCCPVGQHAELDPAHGNICKPDPSYGSCPDGRVVPYDPTVGFNIAEDCYIKPAGDYVAAEVKKFPTALVVGGGLAAVAVLFLMLRK